MHPSRPHRLRRPQTRHRAGNSNSVLSVADTLDYDAPRTRNDTLTETSDTSLTLIHHALFETRSGTRAGDLDDPGDLQDFLDADASPTDTALHGMVAGTRRCSTPGLGHTNDRCETLARIQC